MQLEFEPLHIHPLNIFEIFSVFANQIDYIGTINALFTVNKIMATFRTHFVYTKPTTILEKVLNLRMSNIIITNIYQSFKYEDDIYIMNIRTFHFTTNLLPPRLNYLKVCLALNNTYFITCIEQSQSLQRLKIILTGNSVLFKISDNVKTLTIPKNVKTLTIDGLGTTMIQLNDKIKFLKIKTFLIENIAWRELLHLKTLILPAKISTMPWHCMPNLRILHIHELDHFLKWSDIPSSVHTLVVHDYNRPYIIPQHIKTLHIHRLSCHFLQAKSQLEYIEIDNLAFYMSIMKSTFSLPNTIVICKCKMIIGLPHARYENLKFLQLNSSLSNIEVEFSNDFMPQLEYLHVSMCRFIATDGVSKLNHLHVHRLNEDSTSFRCAQIQILHIDECAFNDLTKILPASLQRLIIDQCDYDIENMILPPLPHLKYVQFKHKTIPILNFRTSVIISS